jgi:hypothetical protein
LVRMRTRKPWVRFRLRLLGWNVLFIAQASTAGSSPARFWGMLPGSAPGQTMKVNGSPASRQTRRENGRVPTLSRPGGLCYRWGPWGSECFRPCRGPCIGFSTRVEISVQKGLLALARARKGRQYLFKPSYLNGLHSDTCDLSKPC